jgi:hypothetical protein
MMTSESAITPKKKETFADIFRRIAHEGGSCRLNYNGFKASGAPADINGNHIVAVTETSFSISIAGRGRFRIDYSWIKPNGVTTY